ncbi:DHS-like NAD/FAD-binding domain-containing protein [Zopfochytrium polystomum]|nr:DHS-like NAD/FAD-binding domain-containing protein [Zopfochytrium polystomum]
MTGAGISTAAGIPDFRTPGTGLYDNLAKYDLPFPEAVFDIEYFRRKPEPFFELAKELFPGAFAPTYCHHFIKVLAQENRLLRCYTQNIDTLERVAGLTDDHVVEAHGSFFSATCVGRGYNEDESLERRYFGSTTNSSPSSSSSNNKNGKPAQKRHPKLTEPTPRRPGCGRRYPLDYIRASLRANEIPTCASPRCAGVVKPDITFFGEQLPARFHAGLAADFAAADALVVVGTSLQVHPFAGLVARVARNVPRLLINREVVGTRETGFRPMAGAFEFGGGRDALFLGDCDDGCRRLAALLGLEEKVRDAMARQEGRAVFGVEEEESEGQEGAGKVDDFAPSSPVGVSLLDHYFKDLKL